MTSTGFDFGTAWFQMAPSMKGVPKAIEASLSTVNVDGVTKSWGSRIQSGLGGAFKLAAAAGTVAIGAASVGMGAVMGQALNRGFARLVAIDTARSKLSALGHDAAGVQTIMDSALTSVKGTAFGLGDAATAAATAVAAGVKPGEELVGYLKNVGDAAAIAGVEFTEMGSIFGKVQTSQTAYTDDLNQLADRGIPIYQYLADEAGVATDEVKKMASEGKISSEMFFAAVEKNVGGAAGIMGQTSFTGALSNMQAALGRVGAAFLDAGGKGGGVFSQLKPLMGDFTQILDNVAPLAEAAGVAVGGFLADTLTEARGGITAFGAAWTAFDGDVTSSGFPGFMERLAFISRTVWEEMRGGITAFGAAWAANDGDITSSGFPGFMEAAAYTIRQLVEWVGALDFTSWEGFFSSLNTGQPALASIGSSFQTLAPAVGAFAQALPNMGGAIGTIASAALPALSGALGFLADNVDTIIAWMPAIVAGFVAWRVATVAAKNAQVAIAPIMAVNNALLLAKAVVEMQAARATAANAAATGTNTVAQNAGMLATARSTFALVAQKTAMVATTVASRAAAAAQWLWNAALTANPIGIIIGLVAALVAGLVWFFTQTELGQQVWANVTAAIGAAATWLWENAISPVFTAIGAIFSWLYDNVITPIVGGIVLYAKAWGAIFTWLWQNVLSPTFAAIGAIFGWLYANVITPIVTGIVMYVQIWGAIFSWLWTNIVVPAFAGIQAAIQAVYGWFTGTLVPGFQAAAAIFGAIFSWVYGNVIRPVWVGIQQAVDGVLQWFSLTLVPAFQQAIGFIGTAFENLKSTITTVWENIKKAAVAPVNFVIETVYNNGIKALFDDIAEAVGLDLRMPTASTIALASGGVLPGYTPGRDVHEFYSPSAGRLLLSGGEGIIRPDTLRALGGKPWLDNVNAARGSAGRVQAFAGGGIWEDITGGIAGAASWIGDAVGNVTKIMTDPSGAIDSLIRTPVKALLESIGGGSFGSIVAEIPLKAIDGIAEWAQANILPPSPSSGDWAGGITLDRLRPLLAKFPGLMITDTYRDPAYNASVGGSPTSFHMDKANPAVDVAGPWGQMNAFAAEVAAVGGWRQLLWQVAGHYDHVHVAREGGIYGDLPTFDDGGWMQPGLAYNGSSSPEPVFTPSQWEALRANVGTGGMPSELVLVDADGVIIERIRVEAANAVGSNESDRQRLVMAGGSARV